MEEIRSNIFGTVMLLHNDDEDYSRLKTLVEKYPVNAFGMLNNRLNEKGLLCSIKVLSTIIEGD